MQRTSMPLTPGLTAVTPVTINPSTKRESLTQRGILSDCRQNAFGQHSRNELSRTFYQKNKQQYYLLHYACCVCHLAV